MSKKKPKSAFLQGYESRQQDEPKDANPYPLFSPHHGWWLEGWRQATRWSHHEARIPLPYR